MRVTGVTPSALPATVPIPPPEDMEEKSGAGLLELTDMQPLWHRTRVWQAGNDNGEIGFHQLTMLLLLVSNAVVRICRLDQN